MSLCKAGCSGERASPLLGSGKASPGQLWALRLRRRQGNGRTSRGELAYWLGLECGEQKLQEVGCSSEGQAGGVWVQPPVLTAGRW